MALPVQIEEVAPQPIAVVKRRAPQSELPRAVPEACGAAWAYFRKIGFKQAGRNVAVYYDSGITFEAGAEVTPPFAEGDGVYMSATPGGLVAHATHRGPYRGLHAAHVAIREWCNANGRPCDGINWEVYGHWTEDESAQVTDVYYLLRAAGT
jgi:effector-binding domain-containing protein